MADNGLLDELKLSIEKLPKLGEPGDRSPFVDWRKLVYKCIRHLLDAVNELCERFDKQQATEVVGVVIAKLELRPNDIVVFWLPVDAGLTTAQVRVIYDSFAAAIGDRFKFLVLVRQAVEIEIISSQKVADNP